MTNMMMNGVVAINGGVGVMEIHQPLPQTVETMAQAVENDITSVDPMNYNKKTTKLHCRLERRQR